MRFLINFPEINSQTHTRWSLRACPALKTQPILTKIKYIKLYVKLGGT